MIDIAPSHNRKAAILIRSLDGETAARILAELSTDEVQAIRATMRELGDVDPDEQADVIAEMRHAGAAARENKRAAVELDCSLVQRNLVGTRPSDELRTGQPSDVDGGFLKDADPLNLVPFLAREHAQTVAVVLTCLDAERAAQILHELPQSMQADVVERLVDLRMTDPETMKLVEHELNAWLAKQPSTFVAPAGRANHAARVLAAIQPHIRNDLLSKLARRNGRLADRLRDDVHELVPNDTSIASATAATGALRENICTRHHPRQHEIRPAGDPPRDAQTSRAETPSARSGEAPDPTSGVHPPLRAQLVSGLAFDQLIYADNTAWAGILCDVDPQLLKLALVGADDMLVTRVAGLFPRQTARHFRSSLHQLGPTRLSDVKAAQETVAEVAQRHIQSRDTAGAMVA